MRVYIGAYGSGLGHASRMLFVASRLAKLEGTKIRFSSSREARSFIVDRGFDCDEVPLIDVAWSDSGHVSVLRTARSFIPDSFRLLGQIRQQVENIKRFGADAVLSDTSLSTVIAGKSLSRRVVTVLNQLRLEIPESAPRLVRTLVEEGSEATIGKMWLLSDVVLIPDLPPPYTISERNLVLRQPRKGLKYIGFLASKPRPPTTRLTGGIPDSNLSRIYWPISGPSETRPSFLRQALRIAEETERGPNARMEFLINVVARKDEEGARRIAGGWLFSSFGGDARNELLHRSDFVVSRAGHTSIAESILYKKPSVLVPIQNQPEQHGNALKAQRLGISVMVRQDSLNSEALGLAIERLKGGWMERRLEALNQVASKYDSTQAVEDELLP